MLLQRGFACWFNKYHAAAPAYMPHPVDMPLQMPLLGGVSQTVSPLTTIKEVTFRVGSRFLGLTD
jgi:hypothetical protein